MPKTQAPEPIRVGLLDGEPIRMEGLRSVFEQRPAPGLAQLVPVTGSLGELLSDQDIDYVVVDLNSSSNRLQTLSEMRRSRPGLRLIVIGPAGNDELIMESIIAGARAYLDGTAGPAAIRAALEVVIAGSIWAPRHLLSNLIDRLLSSPDVSRTNGSVLLTDREREVLDLILLARSNREIARALGIEARTVKAHVSRLMRKTGTENRIDLSMWALRGTLPPKRS
ncbi:MAG TPA: response regulator transcription factor [Terracidiphilus sp.]|nr:response regulator transcription factor [Terracidiphilus sp.]